MKSYTAEKAVIVRDAKEPVIMLCHNLPDEKPDLLHIVGGEVWITDWDTFFDAGLMGDDEVQYLPICGSMTKPRTDARIAWEYFFAGADSGEYGEPWSEAEGQHRRDHFAALATLLLGHQFIFKAKEVA